ncbi:MAG: hypothetical protein ABI992_05325 [Chthoniobacterales bacterium]
METTIFVVLVAVIGLVRWFAQAVEDKRNAEAAKRNPASGPAPSVTPAPPRAAPQSEEERVRKFLDALGVPSANTPPPRVQPATIPPKPATAQRKFLPVDPFPVPRATTRRLASPPPLPTVVPLSPSVSSLPAPAGVVSASVRRPVLAPEFEVQEMGLAEVSARLDATITPLAARLATPQGLRDAIVLREILGPPRSMQPFDHRSRV